LRNNLNFQPIKPQLFRKTFNVFEKIFTGGFMIVDATKNRFNKETTTALLRLFIDNGKGDVGKARLNA